MASSVRKRDSARPLSQLRFSERVCDLDRRLLPGPGRLRRGGENGESVQSREGLRLHSAVSHHQLVQRGQQVFTMLGWHFVDSKVGGRDVND